MVSGKPAGVGKGVITARDLRRKALLAGSVALVTGASSGIGAAVARRLAAEGLHVLLAARRLERLDELARSIRERGGQADTLQVDLADESAREQLVAAVTERWGTPQVLVNNAGSGWYGYFAEMPWQHAREIMQVNNDAVVHLTLGLLPGMLARGSGAIINIGSINGSLSTQGTVIYGASKSFLDAFSSALYRELRGTGVFSSVVRAGPVTSEFFSNVKQRQNGMAIPIERFAIPAERVADCTWRLLCHPRRVAYVPGLLALVPWIEPPLGWFMDQVGPLLLRRVRRLKT